MADEERDVIEVLEHDHREVEQMFGVRTAKGAAEWMQCALEHVRRTR